MYSQPMPNPLTTQAPRVIDPEQARRRIAAIISQAAAELRQQAKDLAESKTFSSGDGSISAAYYAAAQAAVAELDICTEAIIYARQGCPLDAVARLDPIPPVYAAENNSAFRVPTDDPMSFFGCIADEDDK